MNITFLLTLFIFFIACGGNGSAVSSSDNQSSLQASHYRAILTNINGSVKGNGTYGTAIINLAGDELEVKLNVADSHANISHLQQISSGENCPALDADGNGDGVIDALEGEVFYGETLVALDRDISSQNPTGSTFPRSNSAGNYTYSTKASLPALRESLAQTNFGLSGRTFVIHGVRAGSLPPTAAGSGSLSAEASLPIACGMIVPVPIEE